MFEVGCLQNAHFFQVPSHIIDILRFLLRVSPYKHMKKSLLRLSASGFQKLNFMDLFPCDWKKCSTAI